MRFRGILNGEFSLEIMQFREFRVAKKFIAGEL